MGENAIKALLRALQARVLDKLFAPTRYPDALGDDLPADVFGPEDAIAALAAATALLGWATDQLQRGDSLTGA